MSAKNYNEGKPRPSLVLGDMPSAFAEMVKLREAGIAKGYSRMNWAESIGTPDAPRFLADNLDSILRHVLALYKGVEIDDETNCHHGSSIAIRACFLMEYYFRSMNGGPVGDGVTSEENLTALGASIAPPSLLDLDPLADFRKKVTKTLYDWSKIDPEYNWVATGPQGTARAFECKPVIEGEHWSAMQGWASDIFSTTPSLAESWQDSLEERPKS